MIQGLHPVTGVTGVILLTSILMVFYTGWIGTKWFDTYIKSVLISNCIIELYVSFLSEWGNRKLVILLLVVFDTTRRWLEICSNFYIKLFVFHNQYFHLPRYNFCKLSQHVFAQVMHALVCVFFKSLTWWSNRNVS